MLVNRVYPPRRGATGRLLQDLARALEQSGWKVSVVTTGEKKEMVVQQNITIYRVAGPDKCQKRIQYCAVWFKLLRQGLSLPRHDVVVTLTDPPMAVLIGWFVSWLRGGRHVHWCHDLYPDLFVPLGVKLSPILSRVLFFLSRRTMNNTAKVITIGRCMAKHLIATGVQKQKVSMIANWADFDVIAPKKTAGQATIKGDDRALKDIRRDDDPKFRILYAGNIGRAHSVRAIIEAADLLSNHKEIEFMFVGDQHVHNILARERGKRALENIKFMPYQPLDNLRALMESGDVHLVSMRTNAQGLLVPCKFYSGLTVGRPTIFLGPEQSELGCVIKEYHAGLVVPVRDSKKLAEAIYYLRSDGDAWFKAQDGALRAAQAYHPNLSLHKWVELLEKVRVGI